MLSIPEYELGKICQVVPQNIEFELIESQFVDDDFIE